MTTKTEIIFDLGSHCIATEVKRRYNKVVRELIRKKTDDPQLETRISMLKTALEHYDFPLLRNQFSALNGGTDATVSLVLFENNTMDILIDGTVTGNVLRLTDRE